MRFAIITLMCFCLTLSANDSNKLRACDLALKACGEVVEAQEVQVKELTNQNSELRNKLADAGEHTPWYTNFLLGVLVGGIVYSLVR
jgi:hypothetical protein